ncbi:enoyl-CoA hydratase/isomerase family protein [Priestia megaterium]|uniref:enoyl-CoA hydratase/isomerase family protein n=1 Tax=Priestia megaterium TaxID=1404 RepID=UPI00112DCB7F|nr:enoyl-CoA hydratase-related protein [Priestia megaterium]TPF18414.1 enoyl-CoA hydratase [Priestia megaterium]TPF22524.1 enoyl-CoA hydratase [Priestia megaterium]
MKTYSFVTTSSIDHIGLIELNRPDKYNALNLKMVAEIADALEEFDHDQEIRTMVISGKGKAFSAGADIHEMKDRSSVELELLDQFADWDRLSAIKKPIIAAIKGFVFGGGFELALCCDIVIASPTAQLSLPEVSIGIIPGAGGIQRLTKLVGRNKALEWLWTGERISAETALHYGIINKVVEDETLLEETMKLARQIALQPPLAVSLIKNSVNKALNQPLNEGVHYDRKNFYLLFNSEDQKEGMNAFLEKRSPKFKGK